MNTDFIVILSIAFPSAMFLFQLWQNWILKAALAIAKEREQDWKMIATSSQANLRTVEGQLAATEITLNRRKAEILKYEAEFSRLNAFIWGKPLMPHTSKEVEEYIADLHQRINAFEVNDSDHLITPLAHKFSKIDL